MPNTYAARSFLVVECYTLLLGFLGIPKEEEIEKERKVCPFVCFASFFFFEPMFCIILDAQIVCKKEEEIDHKERRFVFLCVSHHHRGTIYMAKRNLTI